MDQPNRANLKLCFSVFDQYHKIAEKSIEDSIKSELSGDFERLMLAVGMLWHLAINS